MESATTSTGSSRPEPFFWTRRDVRRLLTGFAVDLSTHLAEDLSALCLAHEARGRRQWRTGAPLHTQDFNQVWDFVLCNLDGNRGEETLFGRPIGFGMANRLRWAKTLRNKYEHSNAIDGPEQLADLLLLRQLIKHARIHFNLRSECAGLIEDAIQKELPLYMSRTTELLGLEGEITAVSEAPDGSTSGSSMSLSVADRLVAAIEGKSAKAAAAKAASVEVPAAEVTAAFADLRAVREAVIANGRRSEHLVDLIRELWDRIETSRRDVNAPMEEADPGPWDAFEANQDEDLLDQDSNEADDLPLSEEEVRDRLIGLRWRIWEELGVGPSADGILRKRLLEQLIAHRVVSSSDWVSKVSEADRDRTAPEQLIYLPEIFAILARLDV